MIIELTRTCRVGCTHCFVNANAKDKHMTIETFEKTVAFINNIKPLVVQITGGDFTEHPHFRKYVRYLLDNIGNIVVILQSSGSFIQDADKTDKVKSLLKDPKVKFLQVRTHPIYYPNYDFIMKNRDVLESLSPKVAVYDDEIKLVRLGRAKNLINEPSKYKPMCSSFFSVCKSPAIYSLSDAIRTLHMHGKLCKPKISYTGFIHTGETDTCIQVGHVSDDLTQIYQNVLKSIPCDKCGQVKNLMPMEYKFISQRC